MGRGDFLSAESRIAKQPAGRVAGRDGVGSGGRKGGLGGRGGAARGAVRHIGGAARRVAEVTPESGVLHAVVADLRTQSDTRSLRAFSRHDSL